MKKILSFLLLGILCSIGNLWADTETPGNSGSTDTQLTGTSYSIAGKYIAGAGSTIIGDMATKGVKIRTNQSSAIVFSVNDGYRIDALTIYGVTNDNSKTVDISGVSIDGIEQTFSTVTMPNKKSSTSATISLSSIAATDNITFAVGSNAGTQLNWDIHVTYTQTAVVTQEISAVSLNGATISAVDLATLKNTKTLTIDGASLNGLGTLGVTLSSGVTTVTRSISGTSAIYSFTINSTDNYSVTVTNVVKTYTKLGFPVYYSENGSDASGVNTKSVTANGITFTMVDEAKTFQYGSGSVTLGTDVYVPIKLSTGSAVNVTFPAGKVATKVKVYGWSANGNGKLASMGETNELTKSVDVSSDIFYATNTASDVYPSVYEYTLDNWTSLYFSPVGATSQPFIVMDFVLTDLGVNHYTITYDKGANGTGTIEAGDKVEDVAFTLSSEKFTRDGFVQTGWATTDGGDKAYDFGGSYTANADITLYPVWTAAYAVTFDLQGHGDAIDAQNIVAGGKVAAPTAPTASGWSFGGWYKEAGCTNTWDFENDVVNATTVLYAKWTESSEVSYYLINAGVLNTTDFRGGFSLQDENYTVSGVDYTKCASLGNTNSAMKGLYDRSKYVAYDSKTDATSVEIAVWNKNSNNKNLYILVVPEGADESTCIPETIEITKGTGYVKSIQMTGYSTVYCSVNSTDIRFCQISITESGNVLPMAGEIGYSVNHNKGRLAANSNNNEGGSLDGMEYKVSSSAKVLNTTETKIKTLGTHYIKFTAPGAVRLQVTTNNTAHYYVASSESGTTNEVTPTANEVSSIDLEAGTWYINPAGADVKITNIAFVAQPTKYAVTFNLQGHGDAIDAQNLEAGEKVVEPTAPTASGFAFGGWYKEAGCQNAWDFENDVVTEATVLYAKWTGSYTVSYYGGTTLLGSEEVIGGQSPLKAAEYAARDHFTFNGWFANEGLTEAANPASAVITAPTYFYGDFTAKYSTTVDFGAEAYLNTRTAVATLMANSNIVSTLSTSNGGGYDTNDLFTGFKTKTKDQYFELLLQQGKQVEITFGSVVTGVTITVDGVPVDFSTSAEALTKFTHTATSADAIIKVVNNTATKSTTTIKSIAIVENYELTTEDDDFYGLYLPWAVTIPSGISAYTGTLQNDALKLAAVEGNVIPAATPVLVKGNAAGSFTFVPSNSNAASISSSLRGVARATAKVDVPASGKVCLTLGTDGTSVAFRQPAGDNIAANKVYLLVTTPDPEGPAPSIRIVMGENNTTDINSLEASEKAQKFFENGNLYILREGVVYDATGRVVR